MYEQTTYQVILQRMLDRVSNYCDKREASVIHDGTATAAIEFQLLYIELDTLLTETFGDTASREFLIRRCRERGIIPYSATNAVLKGEFTPSTLNIAIGSRFSLNQLNYYVKSKITDGEYQMECETSGIEGNQSLGDLIPIDYIDGLETAQLTEVLIPGEDEEATEALRTRYFASFDTKSFGGNRTDYIEKTNKIAGVGSTKVTALWNGGNTVKLTILDSNYDKATNILIAAVQEEIDPTQDGEGYGVAPIGHVVTVDTVTEVSVTVKATFTFDEGYSWETLSTLASNTVAAYLLELRQIWADQNNMIVRIAQIETRLLAIPGIIDISNTKINNVASNLTLTQYQIPVLGGVTQ